MTATLMEPRTFTVPDVPTTETHKPARHKDRVVRTLVAATALVVALNVLPFVYQTAVEPSVRAALYPAVRVWPVEGETPKAVTPQPE